MKLATRLALAAAVLAFTACSTVSFTVARQALYPSKKAGCHIDWVHEKAAMLGPMNPDWEVIGNIAISQSGDVEIDDAMHKRIDDAACKMGGDAISLGISATSQAFAGSGSSTVLMVLRHKHPAKAPAAAPAPTPSASSSTSL